MALPTEESTVLYVQRPEGIQRLPNMGGLEITPASFYSNKDITPTINSQENYCQKQIICE
ncbi:hypothetical protein [Marseilla massiliensis]|jgi:hypothetical protein|uniref:hypothetical protein n=1 Tax=Marseilla massiliensis TaxID=1841864 RepID=UPI002011CA87|nr:hypothetical protein [Marseilla massiliensis]MCL1610280.1 hypothetical protein [Marseilla massiliensis]